MTRAEEQDLKRSQDNYEGNLAESFSVTLTFNSLLGLLQAKHLYCARHI